MTRQAVVGKRDTVGVEGVRAEDIRAGLQVSAMDGSDRVRLRDRKQVIATFQIAGVVLVLRSPEPRFVQAEPLDHRAHGPVEDQDSLTRQLLEAPANFPKRGHLARFVRS